jgi:hypothetical protein
MPVVINEFEVVTEPTPPPAAPAGQAPKPPPPAQDVERVLAELRARERRVRAY